MDEADQGPHSGRVSARYLGSGYVPHSIQDRTDGEMAKIGDAAIEAVVERWLKGE